MKKSLFSNIFKFALFFVAATIMVTACDDDDDENDDNGGEIVLDGFYITGSAVPSANAESAAMMWEGRIDNFPDEPLPRDGMYEKYVMVKSEGDFQIQEVLGGTTKTWGLDGNLTEGDTLISGAIVENGSPISISNQGFYHVVVDKLSGKILLHKVVDWGITGDATASSEDVTLQEQSLTQEAGTWQATGIEMRANWFKVRYNQQWGVSILDTVTAFTDLGAPADNMKPGGSNFEITAEEIGVYTVTLDYTYGEGFALTKEKTGDLDFVNWSGVALELVGDGVDSTNTNAQQDPSDWGWGYVLQDDAGEPTVDGNVYTWKWTNATLVDSTGFKIRTINAEAPENGNGAAFNVGTDAVDFDNSSENVVGDGDIMVTPGGDYDIELVIDAADGDSKTVTITESAAK